jgi:hypothetical protein
MAEHADSSTLNVQPRQRRMVYEDLAKVPAGRSVKELLRAGDLPESDLRETLRKLDSAGLAQRIKHRWRAVPLRGCRPRIHERARDGRWRRTRRLTSGHRGELDYQPSPATIRFRRDPKLATCHDAQRANQEVAWI